MTSVKEAQCRIVAENRRKQDEVKEDVKGPNSVKRSARIINRGISYDNILSAVTNFLGSANTTEDSTDSILQATHHLSFDTPKDTFIYMGGNISDFSNLKKQTVTSEIERRWGDDIIK